MPSFSCLVCGSQAVSEQRKAAYYLSKPDGIYLYRCKACGTITSPDHYDAYDTIYYAQYDNFVAGTEAYTQRTEFFHQRATLFAQQVEAGNILDVGCGVGHFLDQAVTFGFKTFGLEFSFDAAAVATQKGHQVVKGRAEQLPFPKEFFAAVHMNHVLEHVMAPLQSLSEIRRVLKCNGVAIIEVPNEFGLLAERLKLALGLVGQPGQPRQIYNPHVIFFTQKTLLNAALKAGLKPISCRTKFSGEITPSIATLPAMIARLYDRVMQRGDLIELIVTPS